MATASAEARLLAAADALATTCDGLRFGSAAWVYNPLRYARAGHQAYIERYGARPKKVVLVGMNPGPFGMVQTGVPFGHVGLVRDWMGIEVPIGKPPREHPKRPVTGFACTRSEVSGQRLWGWARSRCATAARFFDDFFVLNFCPLAFLEESGRNLTPDKLAAGEREKLFAACEAALAESVEALEPEWLVGIGAFAAARVLPLARARGIGTGAIPHPSPASPAANRGWNEAAESAFARLGIALPGEGSVAAAARSVNPPALRPAKEAR